jgi:hypothetical protein
VAVTLTIADRIDPVAIYAAVVSTSVLIWQIFVWLRTGPRLKVSAASNMKAFGGVPDNDTYVLANVHNIGTQPTTITHVVIFAYRNWWKRLRKTPSNTFWVNHGVAAFPIPYVLQAGHTFMSMIVQNVELEKLSRESLLFVGIVHSFRDRPVLARIHPIKVVEDTERPAAGVGMTKGRH